MSYEEIQGITQLVAGLLFLCVLIGVIIYVMRPSNKEHFKRLAALTLENEDIDQRK